MKSYETLSAHESLRIGEVDERQVAPTHLERATSMGESRARALSELAAHIDASLHEALAKKIAHEKKRLVELISHEERVAGQKRRLDKVLRTEYFTYRRLGSDILSL